MTQDHIHLIGIGGTGLSAIARVLHEKGILVSGSDRQLSKLAAELQEVGVNVRIGHDPSNINGATLVVRSSAVLDDNVEVSEALQRGIPVIKRAEFLDKILSDKRTIAISGTHGKTTTTSMVAWMLADQKLDPSYIVGGIVANLGTNAHAGEGAHFVIEADEYDRMFLGLNPDLAVITNVEHDHPDCYPTVAEIYDAFEQFILRLKPDGILLACGDDPGTREVIQNRVAAKGAVLTFGLSAENTLFAAGLEPKPGAGYSFEIYYEGIRAGRADLQVPGIHNVCNALAALLVGKTLGLEFDAMITSLNSFVGASKRFEVRGERDGVVIIDDYAHHPTEIRATISAASDRYPGRPIWVVWQPHTYSRTTTLFDAYSHVFYEADHVVVTDVFAAREDRPPKFGIHKLVDSMPHPDVMHIPGVDSAASFLSANLEEGDILLTLSAGDAHQISDAILNNPLEAKNGR